MAKFKLLAALVAGLTLSFPAMATLYKWVDNNGTTHYGETIPREEAEATLERERHDKTLINIYNSVDEIDLARIRNVQQIDARINAVNASIKAANDNLLSLQTEADNLAKANRKIPASLQQDLQDAQDRLTKLQQEAAIPQAEKAALEARFDADKARYIE